LTQIREEAPLWGVSSAVADVWLLGRFVGLGFGQFERDTNPERRALTQRAGEVDLSAVLLDDDGSRYGQPLSRALATSLVVKKCSRIFSLISSGMPPPVSVAVIGAASWSANVDTVIVPRSSSEMCGRIAAARTINVSWRPLPGPNKDQNPAQATGGPPKPSRFRGGGLSPTLIAADRRWRDMALQEAESAGGGQETAR
jgi:hypothetical protein